MEYSEFFKKATGRQPYPYQTRLAQSPWPHLLDIPTGLGKTAAVTLAWLWKHYTGVPDTPRRLVYCLPMRVLVEQTYDACQDWVHALKSEMPVAPSVYLLMGGEIDNGWDATPENLAILVGTQDMLLSRALNRGYAMSRFRWPMAFAFLNNDALWLLDETQLMGVGSSTAAQLQGLRCKLQTSAPVRTLWMSATLGESALETVDHPRPRHGWHGFRLDEVDLSNSDILLRTNAAKKLAKAPLVLDKASRELYPRQLAKTIVDHHIPGSLTLVVVNQVVRAQGVYEQLRRLRPEMRISLLHSRFRPVDRRMHEQALKDEGDRIIVSTQVVEAGVDVSARTLFTELAPWSSLVQRFGRCNRYGELDGGNIVWFDIVEEADCKPYSTAELAEARAYLESISDASIATLRTVPWSPPPPAHPLLRRKDVVDLFDTTPDLSGQDVDVSVYIRDADDDDVRVYWRAGAPTSREAAPSRDELCSIPIKEARDFVEKHGASLWDHLTGQYRTLHQKSEVRPGQVLRLESSNGGYSPEAGWIGLKAKSTVVPVPTNESCPPAMDDERESNCGRWVPLRRHLDDVAAAAGSLAATLNLDPEYQSVLEVAGRWHDVGKAHEAFQTMLDGDRSILWAKSDRDTSRPRYLCCGEERTGFRHELASALAFLSTHAGTAHADLIAYLIAAHHGKIRLSIRAMPNEKRPANVDRLFARGVWDGDILPPVPPDPQSASVLNLDLMRVGEGSWLERTLRLRDELGPFRLAWLEALLRVADWRASEAERHMTVEELSACLTSV